MAGFLDTRDTIEDFEKRRASSDNMMNRVNKKLAKRNAKAIKAAKGIYNAKTFGGALDNTGKLINNTLDARLAAVDVADAIAGKDTDTIGSIRNAFKAEEQAPNPAASKEAADTLQQYYNANTTGRDRTGRGEHTLATPEVQRRADAQRAETYAAIEEKRLAKEKFEEERRKKPKLSRSAGESVRQALNTASAAAPAIARRFGTKVALPAYAAAKSAVGASDYLRRNPVTAGNVARSGLRGMASAVDSLTGSTAARKGLDYVEGGAEGLGAAYYGLVRGDPLKKAMATGTSVRKGALKRLKRGK